MKGIPATHLNSDFIHDLSNIQKWLSEEMIDEINEDSYCMINIISPSFSTDPLYIFDIVNQGLDSIEIFNVFIIMLESGNYEKNVNYYNINKDFIDLDMQIDYTTPGLAVLKSTTTSLDYKVKMLKFLLEQDMFPNSTYEFLTNDESQARAIFNPNQIEILKATIRPFLPQWYLNL